MSIVSGIMGAEAAGDAADAGVKASEQASAVQKEMFDIARADATPWRQAGQMALETLVGGPLGGTTSGAPSGEAGSWSQPVYEQQITGYKTETNWDGVPIQTPIYGNVLVKPSEWVANPNYNASATTTPTEGMLQKGPGEFDPQKEPGYVFGYQEFVEKPLMRQQQATGQLRSTATTDRATRYATDYASTKYDNFLDRWYKSLDPYFRLAGGGSNVAISGGNQAIQTGQSMGNNALYGGQAEASGAINQANAATGAINNALQGYSFFKGLNSGNTLNYANAANTYGGGSIADWYA